MDVDVLPQGAQSQYRPDRPLLWVRGSTLRSNQPLWLPYEMVHSNYTLPGLTGHGCFHASTNGLASGNHILEAVCHAICELIERDATTLWYLLDKDARAATRLIPGSIDDPGCRQALVMLEEADFDVVMWDMTSDIGVATFYCVIRDRHESEGHLGVGAGTHSVREVALLRAITEAVQTRTTYITGSRDDIGPDEYTRSGILAKHRMVQGLLEGSAHKKEFCRVESNVSNTFERDLNWLLERLDTARVGPATVVDLSNPSLPISVVRVVIPGLEAPHDDDDYLPGPRAMRLQRQAS